MQSVWPQQTRCGSAQTARPSWKHPGETRRSVQPRLQRRLAKIRRRQQKLHHQPRLSASRCRTDKCGEFLIACGLCSIRHRPDSRGMATWQAERRERSGVAHHHTAHQATQAIRWPAHAACPASCRLCGTPSVSGRCQVGARSAGCTAHKRLSAPASLTATARSASARRSPSGS